MSLLIFTSQMESGEMHKMVGGGIADAIFDWWISSP